MDEASPDAGRPFSDRASWRRPRDPRLPPEPPMRVVRNGWWSLREETVPREELERQDRLRKK